MAVYNWQFIVFPCVILELLATKSTIAKVVKKRGRFIFQKIDQSPLFKKGGVIYFQKIDHSRFWSSSAYCWDKGVNLPTQLGQVSHVVTDTLISTYIC